jgi:Ca2+-binding EF-hand superfamily protein
MLDKDGNGYVEREELEEVFKRTFDVTIENGLNNMNGKSLDEVIMSCDKDGNGIIDYTEFKAAMMID